ncbi:MAG: hypothetical protein IT426_17190 [Pirellulales bacterium]|nr:hypothetical protein [Pirellulales bacterium]
MTNYKRVGLPVLAALLAVNLAFAQGQNAATPELPIPRIDELIRADRHTRPSPEEVRSAAFLVKTEPHRVAGNAYAIVTDHREEGFLEPMRRLAKHHAGVIIEVDDLGELSRDEKAREKLITQLRQANPRFVAIAPRRESFRENMLLNLWRVLSTLDPDPQIDAFPGLLLAPNSKAFAALVDRSIAYRPPEKTAFRPFVMGQVLDSSVMGQRSLQKVGIMETVFAERGYSTSSLITRSFRAGKPDAGESGGERQWEISAEAPRKPIATLPPRAKKSLDDASLLVIYGHGVPGMTCGLDVGAFRDVEMKNKVVLCGSCFSAAPRKSDFPAMPRGPDGSEVQFEKEDIAFRAVENGSVAVYGHMRLNAGFPNLYPVLEAWMSGATIGEAYQRQLNALIALSGLTAEEFVLQDTKNQPAAMRRNALLYVIIGDPALQPLGDLCVEKKTKIEKATNSEKTAKGGKS